MAFPNKNYTLGSGEVWFGQFAPATTVVAGGMEYIGNTPSFNINTDSESLDHFDADHGLRQKDDTVLLELNRAGSFTCDHMSPRNIARWLLGTASIVSQGILTSVVQLVEGVTPGRRIQIGESGANPFGVRGLSTVLVENATTTTALVANVDYTVDLVTGGLIILESSILFTDGDDVEITYSGSAQTYNEIKSGASAQLEGRMMFKSFNGKGLKFDYLWPYVTLKPDGDFELKGEDWQALGFTFEALKLNETTEVVYVRGRPGEGTT